MPQTPMGRVQAAELPKKLGELHELAMSRVGDATAIEVWAKHPAMLEWYFEGFYRNIFSNGDPRMLVDVRTKELIRIKLSKQHGCFFCNRWNRHDCLAAGLTDAQIDGVLELTPELYARLRQHFSDAEIVEMSFIAAVLTGMAKHVFVLDLVDREEICPIGRRPRRSLNGRQP